MIDKIAMNKRKDALKINKRIVLIAAVLWISLLPITLTACENEKEIEVSIMFENGTDYEITGISFQIANGYRMNNPMRGPDVLAQSIKSGEERRITFTVPQNNLDAEWWARLRIAGEEDYFQYDRKICFDHVGLFVIDCDDEMNFTFTPYTNFPQATEDPNLPDG